MRSRRSRPGACGILVRVVDRRVGRDRRWGARRQGRRSGREDATRSLVETIDRLIAAGWAEQRVEPARAGRRRRVPPPGVARPGGQDPHGRRGARVPRRPEPGEAAAAGRSPARRAGVRRPLHDHRAAADDPRGRHEPPAAAARAGVRGLAPPAGRRECRLRPDRPRTPDRPRRRRRSRTARRSRASDASRSRRPCRSIVAKEVKGENLAASTARLFLGLRLECAQCHNHPFASWTRDQFWGYAAFFSSLERQGPPAAVALAGTIREVPDRREATIPGTEQGRAGGLPRRRRAGLAARGPDARDPGRVDDRPRQPLLRPRRGQPRLGPALRRRPGRPGRRHGGGQPAEPPRAARRPGTRLRRARLRPQVPDPGDRPEPALSAHQRRPPSRRSRLRCRTPARSSRHRACSRGWRCAG